MAQLPVAFNAAAEKPAGVRHLLPAGWYSVIAQDSELKAASSNQANGYLAIKFAVTDGEQAGNTVIARLNLFNSNETSVRIARGELSAICHAVGLPTLTDSAELHGRPLRVLVEVEKSKYLDDKGVSKEGENNVIKGFRYIDDTEIVQGKFGSSGAVAPTQGQAFAQQAAPQASPYAAPAPAFAPQQQPQQPQQPQTQPAAPAFNPQTAAPAPAFNPQQPQQPAAWQVPAQ